MRPLHHKYNELGEADLSCIYESLKFARVLKYAQSALFCSRVLLSLSWIHLGGTGYLSDCMPDDRPRLPLLVRIVLFTSQEGSQSTTNVLWFCAVNGGYCFLSLTPLHCSSVPYSRFNQRYSFLRLAVR